jgi:hypothetical protein
VFPTDAILPLQLSTILIAALFVRIVAGDRAAASLFSLTTLATGLTTRVLFLTFGTSDFELGIRSGPRRP